MQKSTCKDTKPGISLAVDNHALVHKLDCFEIQFLKVKMESPFKAGEAIGQTIECMDGSFEVHEWCLYQSDFLLSFFEGSLFKIRQCADSWSAYVYLLGRKRCLLDIV